MESGNIKSQIHEMDEKEERAAKEEKAEMCNLIAYLSPILIGWGIVVVLIGVYGFMSPSSDRWLQSVIVSFGVVFVAVGLVLHFHFKRKADELEASAHGTWTY